MRLRKLRHRWLATSGTNMILSLILVSQSATTWELLSKKMRLGKQGIPAAEAVHVEVTPRAEQPCKALASGRNGATLRMAADFTARHCLLVCTLGRNAASDVTSQIHPSSLVPGPMLYDAYTCKPKFAEQIKVQGGNRTLKSDPNWSSLFCLYSHVKQG